MFNKLAQQAIHFAYSFEEHDKTFILLLQKKPQEINLQI